MSDELPAARSVLRAERVLDPGSRAGAAWVLVEGERVVEVTDEEPRGWAPPGAVLDLGAALVVPGFVDVHCHGGGGTAFSDGEASARTALAAHRRHGTTSTVASLVSDTAEALEGQVRALAPLVDSDDLVGIHLEGPWLSEAYAGAHAPDLLTDPDVTAAARLLEAAPGAVSMVTLAPELPGGLDLVGWLAERGVLPALGHSDATYEQAGAAVDAGVRVATHLFNAERGVHHREPGPVAAMLERDGVVVELIADGVHLHPAVLREAARRAAGRFVLVTDAMAAAAAPDGRYRLGPVEVDVSEGVARVAGGGAIAGSVLTSERALRHAVEAAGIPLEAAVTALTRTPADLLRRPDLGRLASGAYADLVVLDDGLQVRRVMRRGQWLERPGVSPGVSSGSSADGTSYADGARSTSG